LPFASRAGASPSWTRRNVQAEARKPLVALARAHHVLPVAIVLNLPENVCRARNAERPDRSFGPHVIRNQMAQLRGSLRKLELEGFRRVHVLGSEEEVSAAVLRREPLWTNLRHERGPFDVIGDVHGCHDELEALLDRLGYAERVTDAGVRTRRHERGRKAVFVGDLCDRGPNTPGVLRRVMGMVAAGDALCVAGNHDVKLLKKLRGKDVKLTHGLAQSVEQLEKEPPAFRDEVAAFLDGLVSHYVLDGGQLVVAHAGLKESMHGRASSAVRSFALYGDTTGEVDEFGLPVRLPWAESYRGKAMVVYGHTPVLEADWQNGTICVDTGCVFGGKLTALRYPERELVAIPAAATYYEPVRPLSPPASTASRSTEGANVAARMADDVLDLEDVLGKRIVQTSLHHSVTIRQENASAALEAMSRFAVPPKWLVYLPPTMSPSETSREEGFLEHPAEAFAYFRAQRVARVVCQEKHMGSRAVVVVCRDDAAAARRFGATGGRIGVVVTRTGRPFFSDATLEGALLARVRDAAERSGLFDRLETDFLLLDTELMPWSAKAQDLVRTQYAAVGAAATAALPEAEALLARAMSRGVDAEGLHRHISARRQRAEQYVAAYRRYCWPVQRIEDLKLAPFHLLATADRLHTERSHAWHMDTLAKLCAEDSAVLRPTSHRFVDVDDDAQVAEATAWWLALTEAGGEGMVVKPLDFVARGPKGLVQPAIKCRGREYLRIIYGPDYDAPEHLARLRERGLAGKRSLALREFALGIEGLSRFVRGEPLRRVHECVFGVLALESEPVDPCL
jgi:protein phosphatase